MDLIGPNRSGSLKYDRWHDCTYPNVLPDAALETQAVSVSIQGPSTRPREEFECPLSIIVGVIFLQAAENKWLPLCPAAANDVLCFGVAQVRKAQLCWTGAERPSAGANRQDAVVNKGSQGRTQCPTKHPLPPPQTLPVISHPQGFLRAPHIP